MAKVPRLSDEIHQRRPFSSLAEEVYLNLQRTAEQLRAQAAALFREFELSIPQYNVLRILRGSHDRGLSCGEISERMVTRDPDMTRLLDGLEKMGLVERQRSLEDRRVVVAQIAKPGVSLLSRIDGPLENLHVQRLSHMGDKKLKQLSRLLEEARAVPAPE